MSLDTTPRRSRRSILAAAAAAAAGAAGLAAGKLAGPDPVAAAPVPVYIDQVNPATALTSITGNGVNLLKLETGTQATALWAISGSGAAVVAQTASGVGVSALATTGIAIECSSTSGTGVGALSVTSVGVKGLSVSGTGVMGHVGSASPVAVDGVALLASVSTKDQVGVRASGRVQLTDRSGRVTISAGRSYVDIDMRAKGGLAGTPLLFANLMTYRSGFYVAAVRANYPAAGKFRIYLNKAVPSSTYVAWLVLG